MVIPRALDQVGLYSHHSDNENKLVLWRATSARLWGLVAVESMKLVEFAEMNSSTETRATRLVGLLVPFGVAIKLERFNARI